ncbi:MAG: hypothetical protein ACO2OT_07800 [Candidatus Caldipriscus sp.]
MLSVSAFRIILINFCDDGGKFWKTAYTFFLFYSSRIINTWYISERRVEIVEVEGKEKVRIPKAPDQYYLFISPTNLYPCGKMAVKPELYRNVKEGDKVKITLGKGLFGVWVVLYTTTPSL